jgi:acylphosphatase
MPTMHLLVTGRVQGVGFRWFVRVAGRRLGLAGWVRNRPDGAVELAASGPQDKLDELRKQVRRGPDAADVEDVADLEAVEGDLEYPFGMHR